MFNPENDATHDPEHWPPCDRAQADGVPCQELGRDCEKCEHAYPQAHPSVEGKANRGDNDDQVASQ